MNNNMSSEMSGHLNNEGTSRSFDSSLDMGRCSFVRSVLLADDSSTFVTREVPFINIEIGGIPGDRHYGVLRPADSRQKIYPRGTMIANRRQISIVSLEDCSQIARNMGLPEIKPEWLGANIFVSGIERLTELPAGVRLLFSDGTGLICEGENLPCIGPGKVIERMYNHAGLSREFVPAAHKLRGIVCSVEREGRISKGDEVQILSIDGKRFVTEGCY